MFLDLDSMEKQSKKEAKIVNVGGWPIRLGETTFNTELGSITCCLTSGSFTGSRKPSTRVSWKLNGAMISRSALHKIGS